MLLLELRGHEEQWVRERLGDKWLGFDDDELKRLMEDAGLTGVKVTVGARRARDPFTVLIASGVKDAPRLGTKTTKSRRPQRLTDMSDNRIGHRPSPIAHRRARSSTRSRSASSSSTARWGR